MLEVNGKSGIRTVTPLKEVTRSMSSSNPSPPISHLENECRIVLRQRDAALARAREAEALVEDLKERINELLKADNDTNR
jgi:hypothetical protein